MKSKSKEPEITEKTREITSRALLLDTPGIIASLLIGGTVIFFSGQYAIPNFILLLLFLLISVAATKYRHQEKRRKGLYEHERGWKNVISNGSIPALCCISYSYTGNIVWISAYLCSLAAAMADKFGSELGVLSGKPRAIVGFKSVRPGTSGAVSILGTFLSFVAALIMGVIGYFTLGFHPFSILYIGVVGFLGSLADSIAGVFEEMGIGTKSSSNIICTLAGAAIGYYFPIIF